MKEKKLQIKNKLGLHARAAAKIVTLTNKFCSDIKIKKGDDLEKLSEELWINNQYESDENDRVLLIVKLQAKDFNKNDIFNKTLFIDESRVIKNSAMSQCVSYTLALTIECILKNEQISGINRIFHDKKNVTYILNGLEKLGIKVREI